MKKKSLAFKLNISTLVLLFIFLSISVYAILVINKTNSYANETGQFWLPSITATTNINRELTAAPRRLIIYILMWINNAPENEKKKSEELLEKYTKSLEDRYKIYEKLVSNEEEKKIYESGILHLDKLVKLMKEAQKTASENKGEEAFKIYREQVLPSVLEFGKELSNIAVINFKEGVKSTEKGSYLTNVNNVIMAIIFLISVIIGYIIIQIIFKSTKLIEKSSVNLKEQSITTHELANNLQQSSKDLSDSVSEQASSVHETSAAINEITSMISRTAENAKESTEMAQTASNKADDGQKIMLELVNSMETIQESNIKLQNIVIIINQINTKTAVINDIVSKTELLSLNASIESARAGEYGKGFAVVSEEVANLAKISGKSAKEIQDLITTSQEQVNKILEITKERIDEGKKVTDEAKNSFTKISEDISSMFQVIQQISEATQEQGIGVRQISVAMSQIDKATQNSQNAVNNTAESAVNLVHQSEQLDHSAKEINKLIIGS